MKAAWYSPFCDPLPLSTLALACTRVRRFSLALWAASVALQSAILKPTSRSTHDGPLCLPAVGFGCRARSELHTGA